MIRSVCVGAFIALTLFVLPTATGQVEADRELTSTTRTNCLRAIEIVDRASRAHGVFQAGGDVARVTFTVQGTRQFSGDANAASAVRKYDINGEADLAAGLTHARYSFSFDPDVERTYVLNADQAVHYRSYPNATGHEPKLRLSDPRLQSYELKSNQDVETMIHMLPQELIRQAQGVRQSLRLIGEETIDGRVHDIVCFPRDNGVQSSLLIDRQTGLISCVEELIANHGRGDSTVWYDYSDWKAVSGLTLPGHYETRTLARNSFVHVAVNLRDIKVESQWSAAPYAIPAELAALAGGWVVQAPETDPDPTLYWGWATDQPTESPEPFTAVTMIAEDLYLLRMPLMDSQVMFYEFDEYIAVFEAPINSKTGRLVIDTIRQQTDKPIKYVAGSHHHDHYFGGFRPFIHDGASVIAGPENAKYIERLASWPHVFIEDEQNRSPREPTFAIVNDQLTIEDDNHRVVIYDVGPPSGHTDEYLVFYFPESKILFNGDLITFKTSGTPRAARQRTQGLYNLIVREKLEVDWIYNSWPITRGYARRGTMDEVRQSPGLEEPE